MFHQSDGPTVGNPRSVRHGDEPLGNRMPMNVPRNQLAARGESKDYNPLAERGDGPSSAPARLHRWKSYDTATRAVRVRSRMIIHEAAWLWHRWRLIYTVAASTGLRDGRVFRNSRPTNLRAIRWYSSAESVTRTPFAGGVVGNRYTPGSGQLQSGTGGGGAGATEAHEAFEFDRTPGATASR